MSKKKKKKKKKKKRPQSYPGLLILDFQFYEYLRNKI